MKTMMYRLMFLIFNFLCMHHVFAAHYTLQAGPPMEYSLPPHEPQEFTNFYMWRIKASCQIITEEPEVSITFRIMRKSGVVNHVNLSKGDVLTLTFYPDQIVDIVADGGGVVELENLSDTKVSARCYTQ